MPLLLKDIKHVKTEQNITKYAIDISQYDSVEEVRKAIKRAQNRERRQQSAESCKTESDRQITQAVNKLPPPAKKATLKAVQADWVNDISNKTILNLQKYGLNLCDFKDKASVLKAVRQHQMKECREKRSKSVKPGPKSSLPDEEDEDAHLSFKKRYQSIMSGQGILEEEEDDDE